MLEESELNRLVLNVLSEKRCSHCRLCLKEILIQDEYVCFQDCVSWDLKSGNFQEFSEILSELLGSEFADDIVGLDAVCMDCVDNALKAQKFLQTCKNTERLLNNVFNNLSNTLDIDVKNANSDHSLYLLVGEYESQIMFVNNNVKKKMPNDRMKLLYSCTECMKQFEYVTDLKVHNLISHGTFTCEKCCHSSNEETEIDNHINSENTYKCTECSVYRCTEESLKEHQNKEHGIYACKDCGKSFRGLDKLQIHEQKHISKNKCSKCGKTYNTKDFFLKHIKLCLQDMIDPHPMRSKIKKTYFCDKCGKGYSTPGGLRVHNRFVHGDAKPHTCKLCNKQFTAPSYLKVHMIKHTGEKNFKCEICTRKFVSKEALLYHTRRHTGEKPYSCTICDEKFVNSSARAEHIKFKHVGPTLMCEICSRKFVTPTFLRQHMKKHHDPSNKLYAGRSLIPPNVPAVENMRVRLIDS